MNTKKRHLNVNIGSFNPEIPYFQRPLIDEHVKSIYDETKKWIDIGYLPQFQAISIGEYPELSIDSPTSTYKYVILDGQHRYAAFRRHFDEGRVFNFDVEIFNCANIEEANYFYQLFNKRIEHSAVELTDNLSITDLDRQIQSYISNLTTYFTNSASGSRPRIRTSAFFDKYMKSNARKNIKSIDDFLKFINIKNQQEKMRIAQFGISRIVGSGVSDSIMAKAQNIDWWLGLDFNLTWLE